MKLTIDPRATRLYRRIKVGEGGSFEWGEPLTEAIDLSQDSRIWAVIRGDGPPGRYLFDPIVEIDGQPTNEATFLPEFLEHSKGGGFQFILPIPLPNVPLSYDVVVIVDGEELCRFPIECA